MESLTSSWAHMHFDLLVHMLGYAWYHAGNIACVCKLFARATKNQGFWKRAIRVRVKHFLNPWSDVPWVRAADVDPFLRPVSPSSFHNSSLKVVLSWLFHEGYGSVRAVDNGVSFSFTCVDKDSTFLMTFTWWSDSLMRVDFECIPSKYKGLMAMVVDQHWQRISMIPKTLTVRDVVVREYISYKTSNLLMSTNECHIVVGHDTTTGKPTSGRAQLDVYNMPCLLLPTEHDFKNK